MTPGLSEYYFGNEGISSLAILSTNHLTDITDIGIFIKS